MLAGPMVAMDWLLPTNNPAPMIPPTEIMVRWRERRLWLSAGTSCVVCVNPPIGATIEKAPICDAS